MFGKKKSTESNETPFEPLNPELAQVERQYKRDVLIVESKPLIRRGFFLAWAAIDVALLIFFCVYLAVYFFSGARADKQSLSTVQENISVLDSIRTSRSASALQIGSARVLTSTQDKYDLFVTVTNPNERWYATFTYHFSTSQGETPSQTTFILPDTDRSVLSLGQTFGARPSNPELVIESIEWHRIPADQQAGNSSWINDHEQFTVTNTFYGMPTDVEGEAGSTLAPRATFTIRNDSPYSYWSADFVVMIVRAGSVAAVDRVSLASFEAGESRDVVIQWLTGAPSSGEVVVVPDIQFFDESVYMNPQGSTTGDVRDTISDRQR